MNSVLTLKNVTYRHPFLVQGCVPISAPACLPPHSQLLPCRDLLLNPTQGQARAPLHHTSGCIPLFVGNNSTSFWKSSDSKAHLGHSPFLKENYSYSSECPAVLLQKLRIYLGLLSQAHCLAGLTLQRFLKEHIGTYSSSSSSQLP